MNGKDLLNQIELNPSQLQYWEVIAKLMQQSLSGAKGYITHNIRNTQGTGIDSIGATIERLKNDGLFVEKVQDNTRAVQTAYSGANMILTPAALASLSQHSGVFVLIILFLLMIFALSRF